MVVIGRPSLFVEERAQVAQLVEQWTENPRVGGSIPPLGTIFKVIHQLTHWFIEFFLEPKQRGSTDGSTCKSISVSKTRHLLFS